MPLALAAAGRALRTMLERESAALPAMEAAWTQLLARAEALPSAKRGAVVAGYLGLLRCDGPELWHAFATTLRVHTPLPTLPPLSSLAAVPYVPSSIVRSPPRAFSLTGWLAWATCRRLLARAVDGEEEDARLTRGVVAVLGVLLAPSPKPTTADSASDVVRSSRPESPAAPRPPPNSFRRHRTVDRPQNPFARLPPQSIYRYVVERLPTLPAVGASAGA